MDIENDPAIRKLAQSPHEIFMIGLGAQLLLGPASIFLEIGRIAFLIPFVLSLLFFFYTLQRSRQQEHPPFVHAHWQLALSRYKLLYIGYAISAVILTLSWLLSMNIDPASPQKFLPIALTRIGVMPTVIMVLACLVIENMGLNMAQKGEIPEKFSPAINKT